MLYIPRCACPNWVFFFLHFPAEKWHFVTDWNITPALISLQKSGCVSCKAGKQASPSCWNSCGRWARSCSITRGFLAQLSPQCRKLNSIGGHRGSAAPCSPSRNHCGVIPVWIRHLPDTSERFCFIFCNFPCRGSRWHHPVANGLALIWAEKKGPAKHQIPYRALKRGVQSSKTSQPQRYLTNGTCQ